MIRRTLPAFNPFACRLLTMVFTLAPINLTLCRTIFDASIYDPMDLVTVVQPTAARPYIQANSLGKIGTATILVTFLNDPAMYNLTVTLIKGQTTLAISALPSPSFSGATQAQALSLKQYASVSPAQYQRSSLRVLFSLSNSATVDVTSSCSFSLFSTGTSTTSMIARVSAAVITPAGAGIGTIDVVASAFGLTSSRLTFRINIDAPVIVSRISSLSFPSSLVGLQGFTAFASVSVIFNDGTSLSNIIAGGAVSLPGLVSFSSSIPSVAASDPRTGGVALLGNYFSTVLLTASVNGTAVNASTPFSCNLLPNVGDGDLGASSGIPLTPARIGSVISMSIVLNVGASSLRALQLSVTYDKTRLNVTQVSQGASWTSGQFLSNFNDPPGFLEVGGTPGGLTGTLAIATVTFVVIGGAGSVTPITGMVLVATDGSGNVIGGAVPRNFIAGSISLSITSTRRSLDQPTFVPVSHPIELTHFLHSVHRRGVCPNPPLGDTNGDCVFDLNDASFTQSFVAERIFDPTYGSNFTSFQLTALDADQNGVIDSGDAYLLSRISFRLLNFISIPFIRPVDDLTSLCRLTLSVTVTSRSGTPVSTQTGIFFDLESSNPQITNLLTSTTFLAGSALSVSKGPGYNGRFWQASSQGNGQYLVSAITPLNLTNIGLSVVQATVDGTNLSSDQRLNFYTGRPPATYQSPLNVPLPVGSSSIVVSSDGGYRPWFLFNNSLTSSACEASQTCTKCVNGTTFEMGVCNRTSQTTCVGCRLCPPGTIVTGGCFNQVDRICTACNGLTQFQNGTNQTMCLPVGNCLAGQQQSAPPTASSNRICVDCLLNVTFKVSPGQSVGCLNVTQCNAGFQENSAPTLTSDRTCVSCVLGTTFQSFPRQSVCNQVYVCQPGEEESVAPTLTSDRTCRSCVLGLTFKSSVGQSISCLPVSNCTRGQYQMANATLTSNAVCGTCPAGMIDDDSNPFTPCVPCLPGTYSPANSFGVCPPCSGGATDDDSDPATPCASCSSGFYVPSGSIGPCLDFGCSAGFSDADSDPSTPCTECPAGNFVPPQSYGPCATFACQPGTIDADSNSNSSCIPCVSGQYVPSGSFGSCSSFACPAGTTDDDSNPATKCVACTAGTYVVEASVGSCASKLCPAGTTDDDSNPTTECLLCGDGVYTPIGSFSSCANFNCSAGFIDADSNPATVCVACPPGSFIPSGSSGSCAQGICSAGSTDDDQSASTACISCLPGQYLPSNSSGPCSNFECAAGNIDDDSNPSTVCKSCGAGTYVPQGSAGQCESFMCLEGQSDVDMNSATPCIGCPVGSYSPTGSSGDCSQFRCMAGFSDADANQATPCIACISGQYSPSGSSGPCSSFACVIGTIDEDMNAATPCVSCGPTTYQSQPGQTACVACTDRCLPANQFLSGNCTATTTPVCTTCFSSCATCNGPFPNNCLTCADKLLYSTTNKTCDSSCAPGTFPDTNDTCQQCSPACKTCTESPSNCVTCDNNATGSTSTPLASQTFLLNGTCTSTCDQIGYFKNVMANQGNSGQCVPCSSCSSGFFASALCQSYQVSPFLSCLCCLALLLSGHNLFSLESLYGRDTV